MFSEWLIEVFENFEIEWYVIICFLGKRYLVLFCEVYNVVFVIDDIDLFNIC